MLSEMDNIILCISGIISMIAVVSSLVYVWSSAQYDQYDQCDQYA